MISIPYSPTRYKGMHLVSLLMTLTLFSGIFLSVNQWATYQRKSAVEIYQYYQALQIAENQHQRVFLGLNCQSTVELNGLRFRVRCAADKVTVSYPTGEVVL
ncbi:DUF5374 domain-containing protein [Caviibacterium pharyngocola]|uniref:DUF5374 domain-containing protein n=1 Tax=Caviibacterium pharyngocola TaxID=28159 RepID=A0A2M8RX52_9PAST|nr:DUF5374 domain-containing protein [Caviibacterium pharyngocola]PJG83469.1 hypothetical protein CVP04_03610 [Caviibacterium pharyngocola]